MAAAANYTQDALLADKIAGNADERSAEIAEARLLNDGIDLSPVTRGFGVERNAV